MNIKKFLIGNLTAILIFLNYVTPTLAVSIIQNGSFEDGVSVGSYQTVNAGSSYITDWNVVAGTVDIIGTYWQASDGQRSLDLSGTYGTAGTISQSFASFPGHHYIVQFDMSGNPEGFPILKTMTVEVATKSPGFIFDTGSIVNKNDMKWETKSFDFTATDTTSTIVFSTTINTAYGPALDNVSVEPLPPTDKDMCKSNGWSEYQIFKNQGDCVSFIETGGRNLPANY